MLNEILKSVAPAFLEASFDIILVVVVKAGLLVWGFWVGTTLTSGFCEKPSLKKVFLISLPSTVFAAAFFAFYRFQWMNDPSDTRGEAIYAATVTFFLVLLPLWAGCSWSILKLKTRRVCPENSCPPASDDRFARRDP
jgi:hypothetical protein